ncbi:uncharacterized protein LOC129779673 isoform X2 [Toxorhynchites rutilus septentrionalis]|uniref:uncharacterized protein LOC129779673 isoform X2 n=1 Tax=Toxorhynchites rutilus septentrionalis TaxID=329112 RepID=UPI00247A0BC8|nr:uncharacterized protein LOC129779673 isoform X2 [Toxorhynchites rutilus septentrionalis]
MSATMDNNDNDNYCYQQGAKPGNASKGAIPKTSTIKYQNQFNNNNNVAEQENLMPQINGAQSGHICLERLDRRISDETAVSSVSVENGKHHMNGQVHASPSHEELVELDPEEAELDDNIYSDDENGSASDDCIYAYRGDDDAPNPLDHRDLQADDETDFLEMDFDPEPSSELENLLENQEIEVNNSFQTAKTVERVPLMEKSLSYETKTSENEIPADQIDGSSVVTTTVMKKTGAIPKKTHSKQPSTDLREYDVAGPSRLSTKDNYKNLKLDLKLCTDYNSESSFGYGYLNYNQKDFRAGTDEEINCLDCTRKEFLMQTKQDLSIQKICRSCRCSRHTAGHGQPQVDDFFLDPNQSVNSSSSETDLMSIRAEQIVLQALNKINELKATPPSIGLSKSMEDICIELSSEQKEADYIRDYTQELCSDNTVTIYTLNCGELTIIEALTRVGVAPNLNVLRQYFSEQYCADTSKMSIPQYLLYMSKRDCDYKKLIDAIKSCCDDPLDVQYYPLDPFSDAPEIVQINSAEIAKRWNTNTNLRQIINFKHKHFHTMNILGKIVNIIRQPTRGNHTNQIINIPLYYKSGSITITRIT